MGRATTGTVPRLRGSVPVLGHLHRIGRDPVDFLARVRRECGDIGAFSLLGKEIVLFSGAEAQASFFHAPDDQLSSRDVYRKMMTPVFGPGVVYDAPTPEVMAEHIAMTFPALAEKRLRAYVERVVAEAAASVAEWGDEGTLDLLDYTKEVTLRVAAATLLGPEIRARLSDDFAPAFRDLEHGVIPLALVLPHLPLPAFRRRDAALRRVQAAFARIIAERRRVGVRGEDFLQTLMDTEYQDGRRLTDDEITGLLIAMLFGGHHTSSATLAWTVIELLRHPEHLGPLREEAATTVEEGITFDALRRTPRLDALVHEVLRVHPPLVLLMRKVVREFTYRDIRLRPGTIALASPALAHSIPESFESPDRFDPDRHLADRAAGRAPYAFIPFGGGHHRCPGMRFGLLQVKAILTVLVDRYELELEDAGVGPDFTGLVASPQQPCRISYRRPRAERATE